MTSLRTRLLVGSGLAAVVLGAGTGGATAAHLVGSKDIADDSIRSVDLKDGTLAGRDVRDGSLELGRQALEAKLTMPQARCVAAGGVVSLDESDLANDADPTRVQQKIIGNLQRSMLTCATQPR